MAGMSAVKQTQEEVPQFAACAIARDVQSFDLLVEDMESALGDAWGGLDIEDALQFFEQPEAGLLEFVTIAIDREDEENLGPFALLIKAAKDAGVKVILIPEDLSPMGLHQLMRMGADDFAPYPLPEGALDEAIARLRTSPGPSLPLNAPTAPQEYRGSGEGRDGVVISVHGLAGGVGASNFVTNFAWELAEIGAAKDIRTCVLDFDLQFGTVSTFLDLPRRDAVFELLSDTESMDSEAMEQAMQTFNDQLDVLSAPNEVLPLDFIGKEDVERLIDLAASMYDFVVIDMPTTMVSWTETVLAKAHVYFALLEMDMRSAQNTLRFTRALKAEDLPIEKVRFGLNRAPGGTDLGGRGRVKRLAESLDISIELMLPAGGKQVTQSCDHGLPLALNAPKNPLRKEIRKTAKGIYDLAFVKETG